jgi:hypothetical protein
MSSIDEYGEIKEGYDNFKKMAESIALRDLRKCLPVRPDDKLNCDCLKTKSGYIVRINVSDSFARNVGYYYIIDKNGRIKERDSELEWWREKSNNKQGCIIITACYGEISQEVQISRFFRDNFLAANFSGRLAIDGYYKISPYIVDKMKQFEILKKVVRSIIVNPIIIYEKAKIKKRLTLKKILSSFIYYPCIFIITIAGMLSQKFKS